MSLTFVEPTTGSPTMNSLLYGPPGTGKTTGACSAPGPILVVNAEGPSALHYARQVNATTEIHEVAFEGRETLDEVYLHMRDGSAPEKTVVIDSLGEVYRSLLERMGGDRPTLQQYGDANLIVERCVRALRDLPVHVVLVAHEQLDDQEGEIVRRPSTGGKKLPEIVMAMMDVVAYTGVIPETEDAPRRYVGQLVEANGRRAKDRSGLLGKSRDLNLSEWASASAGPPASTNGGSK
jgi:hypothetical protein